jgi:hypothetical protein
MLQFPEPEPGYAWARLDGGPMDGELILAPVEAHRFNLPATLIGVLAGCRTRTPRRWLGSPAFRVGSVWKRSRARRAWSCRARPAPLPRRER